jgi:hypothetical protein
MLESNNSNSISLSFYHFKEASFSVYCGLVCVWTKNENKLKRSSNEQNKTFIPENLSGNYEVHFKLNCSIIFVLQGLRCVKVING